jgi:hypothetical protein
LAQYAEAQGAIFLAFDVAILWDDIGYPIAGARIEADRIRWKISPLAAYTDWYALRVREMLKKHCDYGSDPMLAAARKTAKPAQRKAPGKR